MNITASKEEAEFRFYIENKPDTFTAPFPGIIHLFIHEYDKETIFWHGVAEVACTDKDLFQAMHQGRGVEFLVSVVLADGRGGVAHLINSHFNKTPTDSYMRLAIVGFSILVKRP
jgi:hypothetical protein